MTFSTLLRDLQRSGRAAYIFITHDIEVVRRVATHVMVMSQGRIVDKGTLREVFAPPSIPTPRPCSAPCRSCGRIG